MSCLKVPELAARSATGACEAPARCSAKKIKRISASLVFICLSARRVASRLVDKWDRNRDAVFRTEVSCDVPFAGRIFDQIDVAWSGWDLLASGNLEFSLAAEGDHKLASWTGVPLVCAARGSAAELHASRLDHLGRVAVEFHLNLFGVTQAIRPRVDARHHDRFAPLSGDDVRLGMRQPPQTE